MKAKSGTYGVLLAAAFFGISGCGGEILSADSQLDRLKILGLVVDKPSLQNPGGGIVNVSLDPYISDMKGSGTVTVSVQSCLADEGFQGTQPTCVNAPSASPEQKLVLVPQANSPSGVFGSPERTGRLPTGPIAVPLYIPANFLDSYPVYKRFNGVPYWITVEVTSGNQSVKSFRRILISTESPNANPGVREVLVNDETMSTSPEGDATLNMVANISPQAYQIKSVDNQVRTETESYVANWYVSDGSVPTPRTYYGQSTTWKAPKERPVGRRGLLVGVLTDDRGGTSVVVKEF